MQTLNTDLCTLEPQVQSHAREMFEVLCDPAIYEFENAAPASESWLLERFERLEQRQSRDGAQRWLNWVIRLPTGELVGYVQATVIDPQTSYVAYELNSRFWRRGIASSAMRAVETELVESYGVRMLVAILKTRNYRSLGLLRSLHFSPGTSQQALDHAIDRDESIMVKQTDVPFAKVAD